MGNFGSYNEAEVEVNDGFDPIPNGDYQVTVIDSETKESSAGNAYIALDMVVDNGPLQGRHMWENLNIGHPNQKVVEIAHQTIKKLSIAMGKSDVKDSADLHGTPFTVTITNKPNKKGEMTEYRKYSPLGAVKVAKAVEAAETEENPWD